MKEKEFIKTFGKKINIPLYYMVDDNGDVVVDYEGIEGELLGFIDYIKDCVGDDELEDWD